MNGYAAGVVVVGGDACGGWRPAAVISEVDGRCVWVAQRKFV